MPKAEEITVQLCDKTTQKCHRGGQVIHLFLLFLKINKIEFYIRLGLAVFDAIYTLAKIVRSGRPHSSQTLAKVDQVLADPDTFVFVAAELNLGYYKSCEVIAILFYR